MKRWIALGISIGIALAAAYVRMERRTSNREAAPAESISAASRAQLDEVLRKHGAGEEQR